MANEEEWIDDEEMAEERRRLASGRTYNCAGGRLDISVRYGVGNLEWLIRCSDGGILHTALLHCAKATRTLIGSLSFS